MRFYFIEDDGTKRFVGFVSAQRLPERYNGGFNSFKKGSIDGINFVQGYDLLLHLHACRGAWICDLEVWYKVSPAKRLLGAVRVDQFGYSSNIDHELTMAELNAI